MVEVRWPDRRADIIDALEALAAEDAADPSRWPDLANAVHWLVDDTDWDSRDPELDVGALLASETEARAVRAVLRPLLTILSALGPVAPDSDYVTHQTWAEVADAAATAAAVMQRPLDR